MSGPKMYRSSDVAMMLLVERDKCERMRLALSSIADGTVCREMHPDADQYELHSKCAIDIARAALGEA